MIGCAAHACPTKQVVSLVLLSNSFSWPPFSWPCIWPCGNTYPLFSRVAACPTCSCTAFIVQTKNLHTLVLFTCTNALLLRLRTTPLYCLPVQMNCSYAYAQLHVYHQHHPSYQGISLCACRVSINYPDMNMHAPKFQTGHVFLDKVRSQPYASSHATLFNIILCVHFTCLCVCGSRCRCLKPISFLSGDVVIRQGLASTGMYILLEGNVGLFQRPLGRCCLHMLICKQTHTHCSGAIRNATHLHAQVHTHATCTVLDALRMLFIIVNEQTHTHALVHTYKHIPKRTCMLRHTHAQNCIQVTKALPGTLARATLAPTPT